MNDVIVLLPLGSTIALIVKIFYQTEVQNASLELKTVWTEIQ